MFLFKNVTPHVVNCWIKCGSAMIWRCVLYICFTNFLGHSHSEVFVPRGCAGLPHCLGLARWLTVNAESEVRVGLRTEQTPGVLQLGTRDYNTHGSLAWAKSGKQTRAKSVKSQIKRPVLSQFSCNLQVMELIWPVCMYVLYSQGWLVSQPL